MSPSGDRLREIARRAGDQGGRAAAAAMAKEGKKAIEAQLAKRSHTRGTPTPSPPGQPPAKISGRLHDNIVTQLPRQTGANRWEAAVGPQNVIYARIQDQGGVAGRGHHTVIPPRPYMLPAKLAAQQAAHEAGTRAFLAAVHGG